MIVFDTIPSKKTYSNEGFLQLSGFLQEDVAKRSLGEFLFNNLGVTIELLFGLKIFPFQEII